MKAYMSLDKLFNDEHYERTAKIAALWFDKVMIQSFSKSFYVDYLTEETSISEESINVLREVFVDIVEPINIYKINTSDKILLETSKRIVSDYIGKDYIGKEREVYLTSNFITYCIEKWKWLNSMEKYAYIGKKPESEIIKTLYTEPYVGRSRSITESIDILIPEVSELSWDKVVELRNHRFVESFRKKISELIEHVESGDQDVTHDILDELVNKSIKEVFSLFEPNIVKQIIKGIASNCPLPIPVNPVSVASAAADVYKDYILKKKYGWLFFYVENIL